MKQLLQKNLSELLRFSTAMSGDRANAEDIVQTAIEKILKNYPDLNDNTEFLKISYRVIRNLFIDTKRKKTRLVSKEDLGNKNSSYSLKDNGDQDLPIEDYIEYNARDIDEEIKYKRSFPIRRVFAASKSISFSLNLCNFSILPPVSSLCFRSSSVNTLSSLSL